MIGGIRAFIRFFLFGLSLVLYFISSLFITILSGLSFEKARPYLTNVISITSRVGLKIIGIEVEKNIQQEVMRKNYLIVCNHLSYIDVLVISSLYPSCFITSKEMKETPFLGQICLLGGCLFVDRKNRKNIHNEVKEISTALQKGLNVAIFPEATSTNGESVLRFKRPLFQAAIDSESSILPMCLNYKTLDSKQISLKNRDIIFWYDEMTFFSHAIKLFSHKKLLVELKVLPSFKASDFPEKGDLADRCHEIISEQYVEIVS
jgi:1-acyl-sn-glycerol-3-phosphate acyltransferase